MFELLRRNKLLLAFSAFGFAATSWIWYRRKHLRDSPTSKHSLIYPRFIGFDCSTQSLKATLLDDDGKILLDAVVIFDSDLPEYKTKGGVYHSGDLAVTSPSAMFLSALDLMFAKLADKQVRFSKVRAISGSGQQHGSVYFAKGAAALLCDMNPSLSLATNLERAFSLQNGPIWMDSSTSKQCRQLEAAVGGPQRLADITGSRAYERFTGNQIAKIIQENPQIYENTERICLISSFMASVFLGRYAPIDASDGSGMNLLDIRQKFEWCDDLLRVIANSNSSMPSSVTTLRSKLGDRVVASHEVLGNVSEYFQQRYGFPPSCKVVAWSGDNPCSLVGLSLSKPGDAAVSLGTSDTFFALLRNPKPSGEEGHILRNPVEPDAYMAMLCFKNGSLTRQSVRDSSVGPSWQSFNQAIVSVPPGNEGYLGFFFLEPEITPTINQRRVWRFDSHDKPVDRFPSAAHEARAVVEGQFLSMRLHSQSVGLDHAQRIIATGGASKNHPMLQILADVFEVPVYVNRMGENSAAYGAGLRAMHGFRCWSDGVFVSFSAIYSSDDTVLVCQPQLNALSIYRKMLPRYANLEKLIRQEAAVKN